MPSALRTNFHTITVLVLAGILSGKRVFHCIEQARSVGLFLYSKKNMSTGTGQVMRRNLPLIRQQSFHGHAQWVFTDIIILRS